MKTPALHFLWIFLAFLAMNCSEQKNQELAATGPVTLDDFQDEFIPSTESVSPISESSGGGRDIVRSGQMDLEINSFDSAGSSLALIAIRNSGYIADVFRREVDGSEGKKAVSGRVDLRVPSDQFDRVLRDVRVLGRIRSERVTSEDVTEHMIDLEARLKTQYQLEERLLTLLNVKVGALSEIVEIEEKLASVRENIEGVQGQLRRLKDRIAMASLSISLSEPGVSDTADIGDDGALETAVHTGLDKVGALMAGGVEWLIVLVPIAFLFYLLYRVCRPLMNRINRRTGLSDLSEQD